MIRTSKKFVDYYISTHPLTQFPLVATVFLSMIVPPHRRAFFDSKMIIATQVNSPNPVPSGARPLGCVFYRDGNIIFIETHIQFKMLISFVRIP